MGECGYVWEGGREGKGERERERERVGGLYVCVWGGGALGVGERHRERETDRQTGREEAVKFVVYSDA